MHAEPARKRDHYEHTWIAFAAFDLADIVCANPGACGQLFLGQVCLAPKTADRLAECDKIGVLLHP